MSIYIVYMCIYIYTYPHAVIYLCSLEIRFTWDGCFSEITHFTTLQATSHTSPTLRSSELIPFICDWFDRSQLVDLGWNVPFRIQPSKRRWWYNNSLPLSLQEPRIWSEKSKQQNLFGGNFFENSRGCFTDFLENWITVLPHVTITTHPKPQLRKSFLPCQADATCSKKGVGSIEPASQCLSICAAKLIWN